MKLGLIGIAVVASGMLACSSSSLVGTQPDASDAADDGGTDAIAVDAHTGEADASDAGDGGSQRDAWVQVGSDAGPEPTNSTCAATPGPHPIDLTIVRGLSVPEDASTGAPTTVTVPDGFALTVDVAPPALPAGASTGQVRVSAFDLEHGGVVTRVANPGALDFVLPPGEKAMTYSVSEGFTLNGTPSTVTTTGYQFLNVCGDATEEVVVPAFPALTAVNVQVVFSAEALNTGMTLTLTTPDQTFSASATTQFPMVAETALQFPLMVPLGVSLVPTITMLTYHATVSNVGGWVGPAVTFTGSTPTITLSQPTFSSIDGTITAPYVVGGSSVGCSVGSNEPTAAAPFAGTYPLPTYSCTVYTSSTTPNTYGFYTSAPKGTTCTLSASLQLALPALADGGVATNGVLLSPPSIPNLDASIVQSYAVSAIGAEAALDIRTVDARGAALARFGSAQSTSLDAPTLAGYGFNVGLVPASGANTVSTTVLSGTYDLYLTH